MNLISTIMMMIFITWVRVIILMVNYLIRLMHTKGTKVIDGILTKQSQRAFPYGKALMGKEGGRGQTTRNTLPFAPIE